MRHTTTQTLSVSKRKNASNQRQKRKKTQNIKGYTEQTRTSTLRKRKRTSGHDRGQAISIGLEDGSGERGRVTRLGADRYQPRASTAIIAITWHEARSGLPERVLLRGCAAPELVAKRAAAFVGDGIQDGAKKHHKRRNGAIPKDQTNEFLYWQVSGRPNKYISRLASFWYVPVSPSPLPLRHTK